MNKGRHNQEDRQDQVVEDSFPASDPPGNSGITGPRATRPRQAPHKRDEDMRPKGTRPTTDMPWKPRISGNMRSTRGRRNGKPGKTLFSARTTCSGVDLLVGWGSSGTPAQCANRRVDCGR
jgi:hypothetical protein